MKEEELKSANKKIDFYKKDVTALRKQLDENGSFDRVVSLENQASQLKKQIAERDDEIRSLQKIRRDQEQALKQLDAAQGDLPQKKRELEDELRHVKDELKDVKKSKEGLEIEARDKHQKAISVTQQMRKLEDEDKRLKSALRQSEIQSSQLHQALSQTTPVRSAQASRIVELEKEVEELNQKRVVLQGALDKARLKHAALLKSSDEEKKTVANKVDVAASANRKNAERVEELKRALQPISRPSPLRQSGGQQVGK